MAATTYVYTTERYGPLPWQTMLVGRSSSVSTSKWAYVYVPGGGWGMRDPVIFLSREASISGDPYSKRPPLYAGAFDTTADAGSTYLDDATVFILNVASESHNGGAISVHQGAYASDYLDAETSGSVIDLWADTAPYAINDRVATGNSTAVCIRAHDPAAVDAEPQLGTDGLPEGAVAEDYWAISYRETNLVGRVPNRGEMTPGSAYQSAADVQRAISHIRRNADSYGIDVEKVLLEGSSAGAQAAGCAAYGPPLNYGHEVHPTVTHNFGVEADCRPNGLIMDIGAFQQDNYASISGRQSSQAFFLSLMSSLFGRDDISQQASWADLPANQKRAMDPYWAAYTSGYYVPTFFTYFDDRGYDDPWSYEDIANGVVTGNYTLWATAVDYEVGDRVYTSGAPNQYWYCAQAHNSSTQPEPAGSGDALPYWKNTSQYFSPGDGSFGVQIHHSHNGRKYMEEFTKAPSSGGLGILDGASGDIRLAVLTPGLTTSRRIFHTYSASGDDAGTFTDIALGSGDRDDKMKILADQMMAFFTEPGLLTKYI